MKKNDFIIKISSGKSKIFLDRNSSFIWGETLEEEENDKKTLSFNVSARETSLLENIRIGRKVHLELNKKEYVFVIASISPRKENKEEFFEVVAEDYASFIFTRNNVGLNLDTFVDEDYHDWLSENELEGQVKDLLEYILIRGNVFGTDNAGWKIRKDVD